MTTVRLKACEALIKNLVVGLPMYKMETESGDICLAYRKPGEVIDDPDCVELYQALEGGIFRRFNIYRGDEVGHRWMRLGPAEPEFLASALSSDFDTMSDLDIEAIPVSLAFTKYKREEAARRQIDNDAAGASFRM